MLQQQATIGEMQVNLSTLVHKVQELETDNNKLASRLDESTLKSGRELDQLKQDYNRLLNENSRQQQQIQAAQSQAPNGITQQLLDQANQQISALERVRLDQSTQIDVLQNQLTSTNIEKQRLVETLTEVKTT